jgi:hypothetical protein
MQTACRYTYSRRTTRTVGTDTDRQTHRREGNINTGRYTDGRPRGRGRQADRF